MPRFVATTMALAACGWAAFAQSAVEAQANVILPDGRRSLVVSNHSSRTVTAFAYQFRVSIQDSTPASELVRDEFKDSVLYSGEPAIGPGKEAAVTVGLLPSRGQSVLNSAPALRAAVYDDGTAFGDPMWVARIRDRRLAVLETLDVELAVLKVPAKTKDDKALRESLAAKLAKDKAAWSGGDPDPERQRITGVQYDLLIHNLTSTHASLDELKHSLQAQRDRLAKAAGIQSPARLLPPDLAPQL